MFSSNNLLTTFIWALSLFKTNTLIVLIMVVFFSDEFNSSKRIVFGSECKKRLCYRTYDIYQLNIMCLGILLQRYIYIFFFSSQFSQHLKFSLVQFSYYLKIMFLCACVCVDGVLHIYYRRRRSQFSPSSLSFTISLRNPISTGFPGYIDRSFLSCSPLSPSLRFLFLVHDEPRTANATRGSAIREIHTQIGYFYSIKIFSFSRLDILQVVT